MSPKNNVAKQNFEGDVGRLDFWTNFGYSCYLGPFGPIWVNLGQFGSIWAIVGHVGQKAEPPNKALEILLVTFLGHP